MGGGRPAGREPLTPLSASRPRQPPRLHLVGCQPAQGACHPRHLPCGCWGLEQAGGQGGLRARNRSMARSRTEPVLVVPRGQPQDTAQPQGKVCLASRTLAAPSCTRSLPLPPPPCSGSQVSPAPAQLPWQLAELPGCPVPAHPSRISYFLPPFISRQSHSSCDSLMPPAPSLLLPGSPDKAPLYLIVLPGSCTLMMPSPGLGQGGMSSAHPQSGSEHPWAMR